jgi:hypothetical protein
MGVAVAAVMQAAVVILAAVTHFLDHTVLGFMRLTFPEVHPSNTLLQAARQVIHQEA